MINGDDINGLRQASTSQIVFVFLLITHLNMGTNPVGLKPLQIRNILVYILEKKPIDPEKKKTNGLTHVSKKNLDMDPAGL